MRGAVPFGDADDDVAIDRVALLRPVDGDPERVAALLLGNAAGVGHCPARSASISTSILPVVICSPSATSMAETVPETGAECTCSIFIASSVITGCPAAT